MRASRRDFLFGAASELVANPLGKPIGLELYTVGAELDKDYDGTLRAIAAIGYKEVETGVSATRKAADVKKSLQAAGLQCRAMHMSFGGMEEAIPYAAEIGAKYVISSVTLPSVPEAGKFDMKAMMAQLTALNLDDFKFARLRNARQ